jgi:hypothetical protein
VWLTVCVRITTEKARKLAAELELDVHAIGICHACLCVVSVAIADVEQRGARSPVVRAIVQLGEDLLAEMRVPRRAPALQMRPANGRGDP